MPFYGFNFLFFKWTFIKVQNIFSNIYSSFVCSLSCVQLICIFTKDDHRVSTTQKKNYTSSSLKHSSHCILFLCQIIYIKIIIFTSNVIVSASSCRHLYKWNHSSCSLLYPTFLFNSMFGKFMHIVRCSG